MARLIQQKSTYRAAGSGFGLVATATDVSCIFGSATKTVKVLRCIITGIQTTSGLINVFVIKRSTANTLGTSTALTAVPLDSTSPAATATNILTYTANPTTGTTVGTIDIARVYFAASTSTSDRCVFDFTNTDGQPVTLIGTAQGLCINLNSITVTGGNMTVVWEWTEE